MCVIVIKWKQSITMC